jgi:hypothetical protein
MKRIRVFCGSSPSCRTEYGAAAEEMAAELARRNIALVHGGGSGSDGDSTLDGRSVPCGPGKKYKRAVAGRRGSESQPEKTLSILRMIASAH